MGGKSQVCTGGLEVRVLLRSYLGALPHDYCLHMQSGCEDLQLG